MIVRYSDGEMLTKNAYVSLNDTNSHEYREIIINKVAISFYWNLLFLIVINSMKHVWWEI